MFRQVVIAVAGCLVSISSIAWGQGLLIGTDQTPVPLPRPIVRPSLPPPTTSYAIKELAVQARISQQVARIQVTQVFENTGQVPLEVSFCFPLPYDGAVEQLTLMIDGQEHVAKLLTAKEAREIYESHVRRNQDPALLEWMGTGMFKTSVFPVPPGAQRKVTIQLTQLLRKSDRLVDFLYPLSTARYTAQPIQTLSINVNIDSSLPIKNVYSPTHAVEIKRPSDQQAIVRFTAQNIVPTSDFRLFFDSGVEEISGSLISYRPDPDQDGYFLLLASPRIESDPRRLPPKTTILVIDRSGSMSGKKIDQAKEALRFVLNNLREGDLFNIVVYDHAVESFRPELQRYDDATRQAALGFVEGIYAGGSTNISEALITALKMVQDPDRPSYIVFLTDGLPTAGETNELKINELLRKHNSHRTRIVSLGVGYDVNSRLLDRIARDHHGHSQLVRPDEDLEPYVSGLHRRINAPVMTDIELSLRLDRSGEDSSAGLNRLYPRRMLDLFAGEQMVLVGRYRESGSAKVAMTGRVGDRQQAVDFPVELVNRSHDHSQAFVEKLWAIRRVGEIIDEIDLNGQNQELIDELVALSTRHGILTPYTSFLADETGTIRELADAGGNAHRTRENLQRQLSHSEGRFGFYQRSIKQGFKAAEQVDGDVQVGMNLAADAPAFGGFGQSLPDSAAPALLGAGQASQAGPTVRRVGNQTLYKRGAIWIADNALDVDLDQAESTARSVQRFSDDYFRLAANCDADEKAILASQQADEELLVRLQGQVYRIR